MGQPRPATSKESSHVDFFDINNLPKPINPLIAYHLVDFKLNRKNVLRKPNHKIPKKIALESIIKHPIIAVRYLLTRVGIRINI